MKLYRSRSL